MKTANTLTRRTVLLGAGAGVAAAATPPPALAERPSDLFRAAWAEIANGRAIKRGRVTLDIPRLAENGNSVPITVKVESAMTGPDHVRTIHVLSERNPIAVVARFHLGPRAGRADVRTYIRLATTQNVHAIAEMSDGTVWSDQGEAVVLLAACLDGG